MAISFDTYRLPALALAQRPEAPQYFADYRELITEPKATVEKTYAAIGLEISSDYQVYLARQQRAEGSHRSTFSYNLEEYSLAPEQIERELDEFYTRYQWPRPSSHINEEIYC